MLIVGAGLCGLTLGRRLADAGRSVVILEKSRGVGGRMATRRTERAKFDHGAQFYSLHPPLAAWDARWKAAGLARPWFQTESSLRLCAPGGLTSLAKNLAEGLDIRLSEEVASLTKVDGAWCAITKAGLRFSAPELVITSPLPQAVAILERSAILFPEKLSRLGYAKALVLLLEDVRSELSLPQGFFEKPSLDIQSIADQRAKGLSAAPAWAVVMAEEFSERYFEAPEEESLARILECLRALDPSLNFSAAQLKKWRYSHPLDKAGGEFAEIAPGLFLAGDAFGGPSLNGAAASGQALFERLISGEA